MQQSHLLHSLAAAGAWHLQFPSSLECGRLYLDLVLEHGLPSYPSSRTPRRTEHSQVRGRSLFVNDARSLFPSKSFALSVFMMLAASFQVRIC